MRVVTLLGDSFKDACINLSKKVKEDYRPDLVIGVLTGGGYIGRELSKEWPNVRYVETKIQRRDTVKKEKGVMHKILQLLPYFMLNGLRMLEMVYGDIKAKISTPKRDGQLEMPIDVDSVLKRLKTNILLVDDAIDTGATLKLITDILSERYPLATIKIAVVTVTSNLPLIDADYFLYHDRTLVRFPWSNDVKQK